ncbi:MAG: hypothetical protein KDB02_09795 [Acidimicrobiales bacterium]|nr:hypothetical protein [Acidimicrobiales bacterium]
MGVDGAGGAELDVAGPDLPGVDLPPTGERVGVADPGPASLPSLVRSWWWSLPLVLLGISLRIIAVLGVRLYRYFDSAEYEKLDFSGRWRRPWATPLLYKILPDDGAVVVLAQAFIGALCWIVLAFAVAALFRRRSIQVASALTVVALGCTAPITNWDSTMLSEPLALSLTVLVVAAWLNLVRRPTVPAAFGVLLATFPWLFVRQSLMPPAWLAFAFVAVAVVVMAVRRSSRAVVLPYAVVTVGLLVSCVLATISYSRNTEILHHNITTVVVDRVVPHEDVLDWFEAQGMPLPANGKLAFESFDKDPVFQAWVAESGSSVYARFLLDHPWYAVSKPIPDFLGANRSWLELPPFTEPKAQPVSMLASADPYGSSRSVLPGPVEEILFQGGAVGSLVFALVVVSGWALVRFRSLDERSLVPVATVALSVVALYAAWHGATAELPRLGLPAAVAIRVAVIVLVGLLVEVELDRRPQQPAPHRSSPTSGGTA